VPFETGARKAQDPRRRFSKSLPMIYTSSYYYFAECRLYVSDKSSISIFRYLAPNFGIFLICTYTWVRAQLLVSLFLNLTSAKRGYIVAFYIYILCDRKAFHSRFFHILVQEMHSTLCVISQGCVLKVVVFSYLSKLFCLPRFRLWPLPSALLRRVRLDPE
jgi:hypothetical protein